MNKLILFTKKIGKICIKYTNSLYLYQNINYKDIIESIYDYDIQHITGKGYYHNNYKDTFFEVIKNNITCCFTFIYNLKNIRFSLKNKLYADNKNFKRSLLLKNANIIITNNDKKHHCNKFEYCLFLKNMILDCKNIPAYMFRSCIRLKRVVLKNTEVINENAFTNCISLETVCIPKNIKIICTEAFANCINLRKIIFY